MATSLPLPKGFFDTQHVRLTEPARRQYIEFAEASIRKVFALSDCHRNSWIPVREKKGVAVYRNFCPTRGPQAHRSNVAEVGGKAELRASLEEVGRAYAAHDDALFGRLMKKLHPGVLDAAVLFTIVPRTPVTPYRYIGIKWFAVKTPTPLVSHRDYCCLEVQDKIEDAFGNEMFLRVLHSIEINECPPLENSHGLVRAKLLTGAMFRADRAEPHVLRVHHVTRFDPAGYFPSQWAYKTAESQLVHGMAQLQRIVEKQQMNACTFVDKKQWVPNHERLHCAVCSRAFGTFRPRHHCRCCGEVICGKCSIFKSVDVPGTTLKNVRICSICNMGVQRGGARATATSTTHPHLDDDAMSDISASSVTSSSTIAHTEMNMMDLYLSAHGDPGTPSAYSSASTQSNLSMRSTASSRSVRDARRHPSATTTFFHTPATTGSFRGRPTPTATASSSSMFGLGGRLRGGSRAGGALDGGSGSTGHTPRSYIANNLTPRGATPSTTPRAAGDPQTPSAQEQRMSVFKQTPLDLGYLRDSVRHGAGGGRALSNAELPPAKCPRVDSNKDGDIDMDAAASDPAAGAATTTTTSTATTTTEEPAAEPTPTPTPTPMDPQQMQTPNNNDANERKRDDSNDDDNDDDDDDDDDGGLRTATPSNTTVSSSESMTVVLHSHDGPGAVVGTTPTTSASQQQQQQQPRASLHRSSTSSEPRKSLFGGFFSRLSNVEMK